MITNNALQAVFDYIDPLLEYIGLGTGAAPVASDTLLDTEVLRKVTTDTTDELTMIREIYLDDSEGNGVTYTNAGLFFDGANGTVETGKLFFGSSVNIVKDNTKTVTISIEITVSEG